MEARREYIVKVCDFCDTDKDVYLTCMECNKHICYACKPKVAKEYNHACYVPGSGDGLYCFACIAKLMERKDPLYHAYLAVETLTKEYSSYYADFKKRCVVADKILADLIAKREAEKAAKNGKN